MKLFGRVVELWGWRSSYARIAGLALESEERHGEAVKLLGGMLDRPALRVDVGYAVIQALGKVLPYF
jgi:hypothetical protein